MRKYFYCPDITTANTLVHVFPDLTIWKKNIYKDMYFFNKMMSYYTHCFETCFFIIHNVHFYISVNMMRFTFISPWKLDSLVSTIQQVIILSHNQTRQNLWAMICLCIWDLKTVHILKRKGWEEERMHTHASRSGSKIIV